MVKPVILEELRYVVSEFWSQVKSSEVKSASQYIPKRTQACNIAIGGVFEHRLGQYKNFAVEE